MTTTDPRPAMALTAPMDGSLAGPDPLSSQITRDAQVRDATEGTTSPQANPGMTPNVVAPAGDQHSHGQSDIDAQHRCAVAASNPTGHSPFGTQRTHAGGVQQGQPAAMSQPTPTRHALLADPFLALAADVLDDLEKARISNENRLRQLTRTEADSDGEERGFGLDTAHPDVARLAALVDMLAQAEHQATLNLQRQMRAHPLGPWLKAQKGIGEKQGARLLAATGDPYWNTLHDRPRLVSELWAYCGYHVIPTGQSYSDTHASGAGGEQSGSHPSQGWPDTHESSAGVAPKRRRGHKANWSATAKMRAHLIATSCIKQMHSPYRATYDQRRAHTATTHPSWPPGHSHNDALRVTAKAILRDLWREARRIHLATQ